MVRTGQPEVRQLPNGRLDSDPAPLLLKSVEDQPDGSAEQAIIQMLFWAQWGSAPNVVDSYDPAIVAALGLPTLTGSYALLRPQLVASQIRFVEVKKSGRQVFVAVELTSKTLPPARESFLMRRSSRGLSTVAWRIVYDTLLERGLNSYVQTTEARNPQRPDPQAIRKGEQAASGYRNAFSTLQLQADAESIRAKRPRRSPTSQETTP